MTWASLKEWIYAVVFSLSGGALMWGVLELELMILRGGF